MALSTCRGGPHSRLAGMPLVYVICTLLPHFRVFPGPSTDVGATIIPHIFILGACLGRPNGPKMVLLNKCLVKWPLCEKKASKYLLVYWIILIFAPKIPSLHKRFWSIRINQPPFSFAFTPLPDAHWHVRHAAGVPSAQPTGRQHFAIWAVWRCRMGRFERPYGPFWNAVRPVWPDTAAYVANRRQQKFCAKRALITIKTNSARYKDYL